MGKKRSVVIGSAEEEQAKTERNIKREQKKLREGLPVTKVTGLGKGQKVVDSTEESLREYEEIQKRQANLEHTDTVTKESHKHHLGRSKSYLNLKKLIDVNQTYLLPKALELLRQVSSSKFDPTVELHFVLKKSPESKLTLNLPHVFGPTRKVAIADDKFIADLESGNLNLDLDFVVAPPSQMPKLVKFAKILGPKGLMPNPKTGTVSEKPEDAAKKLASDTSVTLKADKNSPVIHTSVGKLSFKDKDLTENITATINTVSSFGLKKAVLKSTMSPAIKLQI